MGQANWMSLGIIVTLLACMVQRLASSMRPTIYASAASCRHIIVLPWKCKSYLPTSRAILWTNCEKEFPNEELCALLELPDLSKSNCARPILPGLLYFPAWRNSFWGALPPTVSWSFLLAGSSLPNIDGPASAAIWANCWVGDDEGDLPTPLSYPASAILLIISSACRGVSLAGIGGAPVMRAILSCLHLCSLICSIFVSLPLLPWWGVTFILAILEDN